MAGRPGGSQTPRIDFGLQMEFRPTIGISARRINKMGLDIRSFREPLKRSIQQVLAPSFKKNFDVGGRPERWEPLSDFAIDMRHGSSEPVLVRSGLLKRTIQQFNIWTVDREKAALVDLPPKIWYGKIHQAGYGFGGGGGKRGTIGKGSQHRAAGIPARPFAVIQDPEDYDAIERVFLKWFRERMIASRAFRPGFG